MKENVSCRGVIILVIIALAFFLHNVLSSEYLDDYVYKFVFSKDGPDYSQRINNLADVFRSQYYHYFAWNGRTVAHLIVQSFVGLLGKPLFNVFNTLVFVAFVWLLRRNLPACGGFDVVCAYALTMVLVFLLPMFRETFLWVAGSVNYLWTSVGILLFILMCERCGKQVVSIKTIPWLILALLLGWTHEALVFPLAASMMLMSLMRIRRSYKTQGFWLIVMFTVGAILTSIAPSTTARAQVWEGPSLTLIARKLYTTLLALSQLRIVYLALAMVLLMAFRHRPLLKSILRSNLYLVLAILFSIGVVFISGFSIPRAAFGVELYSLLLLMRLLGGVWPSIASGARRWGGVLMAAGVAVFYLLVLWNAFQAWQEDRRQVAQIHAVAGAGGVIATNEHPAGVFSPFICTMIEHDSSVNSIYYAPHREPYSIASAFGCDSLVFLPQAFLDDLRLHPDHYTRLDLQSPFEFFAVQLGDGDTIHQVTYLLKPLTFKWLPASLQGMALELAHKVEPTSGESLVTDHWVVLELYRRRYLLIKRFHYFDTRLTGIGIE